MAEKQLSFDRSSGSLRVKIITCWHYIYETTEMCKLDCKLLYLLTTQREESTSSSSLFRSNHPKCPFDVNSELFLF